MKKLPYLVIVLTSFLPSTCMTKKLTNDKGPATTTNVTATTATQGVQQGK